MDSATALDLAPCGLLLLDADYRIVSANRYVLDLANLTPDDIAKRPKFSALFSVASRIFIQTRMQPDLILAGRLEELALDLVRPDGSRVPVMLNAVQESADGAPGRIRIALWSAAAKRAYEAEAPKARLAAAAATQVKADFLANVSHELRTPLNGVVGSAAMLEATDLSPRQRELVAMIAGSADSLGSLIADILDLSRVQAGSLSLETRAFDLSEMLAPCLDRARLQAGEKGLAFHVDIGTGLYGAYDGDPVRLRQILNHLLSNAVKFTPAGDIRVEIAEADGDLKMVVADTGVGFDESTTEQLFQPFGQAASGATRDVGGAGLGLSIVQALVALMGGAISVASRPGHGSRVDVRVPLPRVAAAPPTPAEVSVVDVADQLLRILLVEDNPTNRRVVELILEACDVELVSAENGAIGLECWRAGRFDVVLMDLQMPVMDGLTAIRAIRRAEAQTPSRGRTPIAVLSANAMDHHRREAIEAGADLHIAKPVTPQALLEGIGAVLAQVAAAA